jgi:hypothetical protein
MFCAYCNQDMTAILSGEFCYARRHATPTPKSHSPWVIEPVEDLEAY